MEEKDALIVRLQNEVATRDHDIHRAATYGNQLLEEKAILSSQIDELHILNEVILFCRPLPVLIYLFCMLDHK